MREYEVKPGDWPELRYEVKLRDVRSGERHELVVDLNHEEMLECLWHLASGRQAGHPDGPLPMKRAANAAALRLGVPLEHAEVETRRMISH